MGDVTADNDDVPIQPKITDYQEMARNYCRPSTGCVCTTLVGGAFSIVLITMGAVFLYECPLGWFIPVYVLVSGVVTLMLVIPRALPWVLESEKSGQSSEVDFWKFLISILAMFLFFWFFIGSFAVYSVFPPNYDKNITLPMEGQDDLHRHPNQTEIVLPYCDRSLYLFAFVTTTLVYISPVLVFACIGVHSMMVR